MTTHATGVADDALERIAHRRRERIEEVLDEYEEEPIFESIREASNGIVVGGGSVMARIMFISFSPSHDSDETGVALAGEAGDILGKLLASIDMDRKSVYVTNILKYRYNDVPALNSQRASQVSTSMRYLRREIAIIKPWVIVPMGADVLSQFEPRKRIQECHGKIINKRDRSIVPMYHPAAVIRNPERQKIMEEDILSVHQALTGYQS